MQVGAADRATSDLLKRYVQAWESDDIDGLVALLKEDATMSMPPSPSWLWGREAIRAFLSATAFGSEARSRWHLSTTGANGQPAFFVFRAHEPHHPWRPFLVQVAPLPGSHTP